MGNDLAQLLIDESRLAEKQVAITTAGIDLLNATMNKPALVRIPGSKPTMYVAVGTLEDILFKIDALETSGSPENA